MSTEINLRIGVLARDTDISLGRIREVASHIAAAFRTGSNSDIRLNIDRAPIRLDRSFAGAVSPQALHIALEQVTGYQRYRRRVKNIGLLIADRYAPRPDFFGLMFDEAFDPTSSDPSATTPREGCAVFLDGIEHRRSTNELMRELIFTAIHEVGHVFNLQHTSEPSFMARSAVRPTLFPPSAFKFLERHRHRLSQCSRSRYVWPGGSAFEDLGPFGAANALEEPSAAPFGLSIEIDMVQREFWPFEPVELDVSMKLIGGPDKSTEVPDRIDPGYREFSIWIEEPVGERRRYRSPRHYCANETTVSVTRGQSIERDISIFGESGGFTFRKVGVHRVWVIFQMPNIGAIRSNVLEVNVLPASTDNPYYEAARSCFLDRSLGLLMYHRSYTGRALKGVGRLKEFCEHYAQYPAAGMAAYALGRASAKRFTDDANGKSTKSRLRRQAIDQLAAAIKSDGLSEHRLRIAEHEIRSLE